MRTWHRLKEVASYCFDTWLQVFIPFRIIAAVQQGQTAETMHRPPRHRHQGSYLPHGLFGSSPATVSRTRRELLAGLVVPEA